MSEFSVACQRYPHTISAEGRVQASHHGAMVAYE